MIWGRIRRRSTLYTQPRLPPPQALLLLALLLALLAPPRGALGGICLLNSCPFQLTAFARNGDEPTYAYSLGAAGGQQHLDFSQFNYWPEGVIWASRTGNANSSEATQIKFAIGSYVSNGWRQDFYHISLVSAYNLPVRVRPLNPPGVSGQWCGSPTCKIPAGSLASFCTAPNFLTGADPACINKSDRSSVGDVGAWAFKDACPQAISHAKDYASGAFSCKWGTNYEVQFCP